MVHQEKVAVCIGAGPQAPRVLLKNIRPCHDQTDRKEVIHRCSYVPTHPRRRDLGRADGVSKHRRQACNVGLGRIPDDRLERRASSAKLINLSGGT